MVNSEIYNIEVIDAIDISDEALLAKMCLAKVGKTYLAFKEKCENESLCSPEPVFDIIEECRICKKQL